MGFYAWLLEVFGKKKLYSTALHQRDVKKQVAEKRKLPQQPARRNIRLLPSDEDVGDKTDRHAA
jgi:hypothetical protein